MSDRWFTCELCGYELPESELCCGSFLEDGAIVDSSCKTCCAPTHKGRIYDGKSVAGGTFERCE